MKFFGYTVLAIGLLWLAKFTSPALRVKGYVGLLMPYVFPGHTTYAAGYTDEKFLQIKEGMEQDEVFKILGQPFVIMEDGVAEIRLCYTVTCECNYHIRQVYVRYGKVYDIDAYYYLD